MKRNRIIILNDYTSYRKSVLSVKEYIFDRLNTPFAGEQECSKP